MSQDVVPGHKVQLHGRRVVLESQEPLPHDGVFLGREEECYTQSKKQSGI